MRLFGAGVVLAALAAPALAQAETFAVTNTNDAGAGSLRAAITGANAAAPGQEHLVDASSVDGRIDLQTALPNLTGDYEVRGSGAADLTVRRGTGLFRIFSVNAGAEIVLNGLTISDGLVTAVTDSGGGILNSGTLTVLRSAVSANTAYTGGGIRNTGDGSLTVRDSLISGNTAATTLPGSEGGGGIFNRDGTVLVVNSTVAGNSAGVARGGGLINSVLMPGESSAMTVSNSTVAGNTGEGGNLFNSSNFANAAVLRVRSTIVADASGANNNCRTAGAADISSQGYNLADDEAGGCEFTAVGDQIEADPALGPLADNGGPTETMAFGIASPAVDAAGGGGLTADQRGLTRPVEFSQVPDAPGGDGTDTGAFELQQPPNEFSFGATRKNKRKGTAKLTIEVPGPGALELAKTGKVKPAQAQAAEAGQLTIKVKARGKARKRLRRKGKAKVNAQVTFTPDGGEPNTQAKPLKLKLT